MAYLTFSANTLFPKEFTVDGREVSFETVDVDLFDDITLAGLQHFLDEGLTALSAEYLFELLITSLDFYERGFSCEGQYILLIVLQGVKRIDLNFQLFPALFKASTKELAYYRYAGTLDEESGDNSHFHFLSWVLSKIALYLPWNVARYEIGIEQWHLDNVISKFNDPFLFQRFEHLYFTSIGRYLEWIVPHLILESDVVHFDKVTNRFEYRQVLCYITDQVREHAPGHLFASLRHAFCFLLHAELCSHLEVSTFTPTMEKQRQEKVAILQKQFSDLYDYNIALRFFAAHAEKHKPEIIGHYLSKLFTDV